MNDEARMTNGEGAAGKTQRRYLRTATKHRGSQRSLRHGHHGRDGARLRFGRDGVSPHHFLDLKNLRISKQIRIFATCRPCRYSNYPQSSRGDSDFLGIFSGRNPSHSGFLQKYGKNLHSTFPTQIQLLGRCDRVGAMTCQLHAGRGLKLGSECSVSSFKCSGPRARCVGPCWASLGLVGP
jgi:hypothetical protein